MYVYKHINIQKVYMYINTEYEGSIDIDKGKHCSIQLYECSHINLYVYVYIYMHSDLSLVELS